MEQVRSSELSKRADGPFGHVVAGRIPGGTLLMADRILGIDAGSFTSGKNSVAICFEETHRPAAPRASILDHFKKCLVMLRLILEKFDIRKLAL